jgi:hypothetical protein
MNKMLMSRIPIQAISRIKVLSKIERTKMIVSNQGMGIKIML